MDNNRFLRSEMLLGADSTKKLAECRVILFGLGGVGSYTAEALARAGIGHITVVDSDCVSVSNINRQLCALVSTVGKPKVEVIKERILDINPECDVKTLQKFYLPENADEFGLDGYDYIADAIDTVSAKIDLAKKSTGAEHPDYFLHGNRQQIRPHPFQNRRYFKNIGLSALQSYAP